MDYNHKVLINLSFVDGKETWHMIRNEISKYSASRVETGTKMKYFNNGFQLLRATDFRKKFRNQSSYEPMSQWVALISLAGHIEPNGKEIVRDRNRTSLVVSCTLENIHENHQYWPDPGLALDPKLIRYLTTHIDYRDGKATIRCNLPTGLALKETPFMYMDLFKRILAKFTSELDQFNTMTNVDHYTTKEGEDAIFDTITTFLGQIGIRRPTAQPMRERLARWVAHGEDPNAYVVKGVAFVNELAYKGLMVAYNNDEPRVLRIQHDTPMVQRLMGEYRNDPLARLREMDLHQLSLPPDMNCAVMDYQMGLNEEEWEEHSNEYRAAEKDGNESFVIKKWQDRVIQRWKSVQGK